MASRNLNKAILIGNLTRDPELRYTPQGVAVASFVVATNREWSINGEKKSAVDFHNVVAWNKLAEICGQLLNKGSKVYVEGRIQTRDWMDQQNVKHYKTEIVIDDMILLKGGKDMTGTPSAETAPSQEPTGESEDINFDDLDFEDLSVPAAE